MKMSPIETVNQPAAYILFYSISILSYFSIVVWSYFLVTPPGLFKSPLLTITLKSCRLFKLSV